MVDVAAAGRASIDGAGGVERLAKGVVDVNCPPIPLTAVEVRREAFLWRLAAAFQALMDETRNPCGIPAPCRAVPHCGSGSG